MTERLTNTISLVTGAGSGLGKASALALANAGARVAVTELPDRFDAAGETVREIVAGGGSALAVALDVRDLESIAAAVNQTVEWGGQERTLAEVIAP